MKKIIVSDQGLRVGESHALAKLTDAEVEMIRRLHEEDGIGYKKLAEKYEISKSSVAMICRYERRATVGTRVKVVGEAIQQAGIDHPEERLLTGGISEGESTTPSGQPYRWWMARKLSDDDVALIRLQNAEGMSYKRLVEIYGIGRKYMSKICRYKARVKVGG